MSPAVGFWNAGMDGTIVLGERGVTVRYARAVSEIKLLYPHFPKAGEYQNQSSSNISWKTYSKTWLIYGKVRKIQFSCIPCLASPICEGTLYSPPQLLRTVVSPMNVRGFENDGHKPWRPKTYLGKIYPTMSWIWLFLKGTPFSFSRFHCSGRHDMPNVGLSATPFSHLTTTCPAS